jgi:hypothetical protein
MNSVLKWLAGTIGLIILAVVFPFVREIYVTMDANGTGILHDAGTSINNGFLTFLPVLFPAVIVTIIIIYVVRKDNNEAQPK